MDLQPALHKVLVVDDDPYIQKVVRMSLQFRGVEEILLAGDGKDCLSTVSRMHPDLILLDVSMPKLDGYETCRLLKRDPETRSIPVIFLTASVQKGEQEAMMEAGALGYVFKPFDPLTLLDQLLTIINDGIHA